MHEELAVGAEGLGVVDASLALGGRTGFRPAFAPVPAHDEGGLIEGDAADRARSVGDLKQAAGDDRAFYYPKFCPECGRKL